MPASHVALACEAFANLLATIRREILSRCGELGLLSSSCLERAPSPYFSATPRSATRATKVRRARGRHRSFSRAAPSTAASTGSGPARSVEAVVRPPTQACHASVGLRSARRMMPARRPARRPRAVGTDLRSHRARTPCAVRSKTQTRIARTSTSLQTKSRVSMSSTSSDAAVASASRSPSETRQAASRRVRSLARARCRRERTALSLIESWSAISWRPRSCS